MIGIPSDYGRHSSTFLPFSGLARTSGFVVRLQQSQQIVRHPFYVTRWSGEEKRIQRGIMTTKVGQP